jgi:F-type H+-transporting ATPase subunit delta
VDLQELARHETVLDDTARRVARVYAEALYSAAAEHKQEAEILAELNELQAALRKDPRLEAFVAGRGLSRERRHAILRAFEGRASEVFVNFLYVLNEHDRTDALEAVIAAYQDLFDQRTGRMRVSVQSAIPLDEQHMERLRENLRKSFGKEPVLSTRVNPDLLGGLVVQADGWLYDSSVRSRLENLRQQISVKGSYEIQSGRDRFSSATGN